VRYIYPKRIPRLFSAPTVEPYFHRDYQSERHFTMQLSRASVFATLLLLPLTVAAATTESLRYCKCQPHLPCWPSKSDWRKFNSTVGGMLIADIRPISSACYEGTPDYNKARCDEVTKSFGDSAWRANQSGKFHCALYFNSKLIVESQVPSNTPPGKPIPLWLKAVIYPRSLATIPVPASNASKAPSHNMLCVPATQRIFQPQSSSLQNIISPS